MADVSISRPDLKGLLSLEKRVLAQRVLDLHDELVRERARSAQARCDAETATHMARTASGGLQAVGSFA